MFNSMPSELIEVMELTIVFSFLFGTILGPIIYLLSPEWSILIAGIIGGTLAYLVGEHIVS